MGPIIIFDKSLLQSINPDEAMWLDLFFICNVTPLFYVETLADLAKTSTSRPANSLVRELAEKTPVMSLAPNAHHQSLLINDLLGDTIPLARRPVLDGGTVREFKGKTSVVFDEFKEQEVLDRWQKEDFQDIERLFAIKWRAALSTLDFEQMIRWAMNTVPKTTTLNSLGRVAEFVTNLMQSHDQEVLMFGMQFLGIPTNLQGVIMNRFIQNGKPPINAFAPYFAHVLSIDLYFYICLGRGFISKERPSNKIDMAYLYYLPFSMAFVSGDRLHATTVPLFTPLGQTFVKSEDMKAALTEINNYYMKHENEIEKVGVFIYAQYPPRELNNVVTQLWDKYCPLWRKHAEESKPGLPKQDKELVERLKAQAEAPLSRNQSMKSEPDSISLSRRVPKRRGRWRIFPPEVDKEP